MIDDFEYHSPKSLSEACKLLKKYNGKAQILAGGTDLIPMLYHGHHGRRAPKHMINIKNIPKLNEISFTETSGLTLGALVRFNDIILSKTIQNNYPILVEVSSRIGSHQIRNLATIGGNLCNAAPSADSAPILIALDSTVTLTGPGSKKRTLRVEEFFKGPGKSALKPGEILTRITVPPIKPNMGMAYAKHTTRKALEIAVVGVAGLVQLEPDTDKCIEARIVVGACAPTPLRVPAAEALLKGKILNEHNLDSASAAAAAATAPISDVRGSADYRYDMVKVHCKRVLELALQRAKVRTDLINDVGS